MLCSFAALVWLEFCWGSLSGNVGFFVKGNMCDNWESIAEVCRIERGCREPNNNFGESVLFYAEPLTPIF